MTDEGDGARAERRPRRRRTALPPDRVEILRRAVSELSWLWTRGYAVTASVKLVGDRHRLSRGEREAMTRAAASDDAVVHRRAIRIDLGALAGRTLHVDGYNLLISLREAVRGQPLLRGRDGFLRDLAGGRGLSPKGEELRGLLAEVQGALGANAPAVVWWFDRPVPHSGRLAGRVREHGAGLGWTVEVVMSPDRALVEARGVVATHDSAILDRASAALDLVDLAAGAAARRVDLGDPLVPREAPSRG